ncbi:hypothetical protein LUZ60_000793 [Juncus effusus]|nr:hypothetical protein LUZ60_000793 [Juncus effusus]
MKYSIKAEDYELYEEIGNGVSASVYRALCKPLNETVAIKILDFEKDRSDLNNIMREVQTMMLLNHPHLLNAHCTFVKQHELWVVMPYMASGSVLHILKSAHPEGLDEPIIATILLATLKALDYLHQNGQIHRDVKAGNILLDKKGGIKLGDFGVSACLFDGGDRQRLRKTFTGTPCWMAPEVMGESGYNCKADIWSFGITALELAHGHAPFSKYPPMKVFLMTLHGSPPGLDLESDKTRFSKSFRQMIGMCLVKEPSERPTARKLLKHSFFKQARSQNYINRKLLCGLPILGDQYKALKEKEEKLLVQKQMPDGEKEELSQNEYKRGISNWNFDLDDLKAEAALIPDQESGESSTFETDPFQDDTENDSGQNSSNKKPCNSKDCSEADSQSISNQDKKKYSRELSFGTSFPPNVQGENRGQNEQKRKPPVVKQRGRFKVTSASADLDRTSPSQNMNLHKSYSMQAIPQLRPKGVAGNAPPNPVANSVHNNLLFLLNFNLQERDAVRSLMREVSVGDYSPALMSIIAAGAIHSPCLPSPRPVVITEKSLIEAAYRKEYELHQEVSDLRWKLECIQDEIDEIKKDIAEKLKDDNP